MAEARRIDRWLFFARFARSRSFAQKLVEAGHVRINRVKVTKPGHDVKPGDVLTLAVHGTVRVLKVLAPGSRRGPATEAQGLYADMSPPPAFPAQKEGVIGPEIC